MYTKDKVITVLVIIVGLLMIAANFSSKDLRVAEEKLFKLEHTDALCWKQVKELEGELASFGKRR